MSLRRFIRRFLVFILNVLQAVFGPAFIELTIPHIHATQITTILWKEYLLSAIISFLSGYFIYRKWLWREVLWVWVAGLAWFGLPALVLFSSSGLSFAFRQLSGLRCAENSSSCNTWLEFTIPFARLACYSAGGWVFVACARYGREIEGGARVAERSNPRSNRIPPVDETIP